MARTSTEPAPSTGTDVDPRRPVPRGDARPTRDAGDAAPAGTPHASPWARGVAHVTGRVLQAYAIWLLVALVLLPFWPHQVRAVGHVLSMTNVPAQPGLFSAILVGVVASGVLRRLRAAVWFVVVVWQLPVALIGLLTLVLVATGSATLAELEVTTRDVVAFCFSLPIIVVLVSARRAFPARLRRGAWWRAVLVTGATALAAATLAYTLLQFDPAGLTTQGDRLGWSLSHVLGIHSSVVASGHGPAWVGALVGLVSAAGLLLGIAVFLRSSASPAGERAADALAVRRLLLEDPEHDSLGYFATRDDRSAVFSPDGRAAVSYRVVSGVSLAAGDPVGARESWPAAVDRWLLHTRQHGWIPAVTSTTEAGARTYRDAGLHPVPMGDEAVVVTRRIDLANPALRPVRRAVERGKAAGYEVRVRRQAAIPADELAELVRDADRWRHGEERGFSMALERLGDPVDPRIVVVTAHDADGAVRGLLSFVPWGRRGLSLDVMRRSPDAVAGVTELMVAELAAASRDLGIEKVSMNFAMFRSTFEVGERVGATPVQRFNRRVLLLASRFWQLEQLYRSNEKYLPDWEPRLMCYEAAGQLTRVVFALGQAEGFLPRNPRWLTGADDRSDRSPELHDPAFVAAVVAQEDQLLAVAVPPRRLTEQQRTRHAKLDVLHAAGMDPYPVGVPRTAAVAAARAVLDAVPPGTTSPVAGADELAVVGRVVRLRDLGGVVFAVLREGGAELQVMLTASGAADLPLWRRAVDLGDQVSVTGVPVRSRSGEPTLLARSWCMAAKALTPPPDKHRGLADPEARVRLRHMDLAMNDRAEHLLRARAAAVWSIRSSLVERGFIEVETPILQRIHGGANARPFTTHINAYDLDLYLRIAPELFLKRLMVGGVGRVFELGRNFRNEGVDATHNPEFTSMEAYQAYGDYTTMRHLTRELVVAAAVAVHGEPVAHRPDGTVVRLDGEWPVLTVHDAVSRALGTPVTPDLPLADLRELCRAHDVAFDDDETHGALVEELYDRFVEGQTVEPTFYTDFPVETSPLTRRHRDDPRLAERWDLVAFGAELGTAYSELVDPVEQRRRLTEQSILAAAGDPEAMEVDDEFLSALEFAMPPTGGVGIGVDRVVMMLVGGSIRDTLAFPFVRPSGRR
ncbi:MAG: bifunctional lysylphosphatidylglycerol synthetase/lysine--tRNA ligase LysX [Cellulomonas iranensis]|uniref:bifunctional lysylphosphatidylglycerol synthetase/lysine--tRNA ligase LysX n=1 Tax=Cellulomonas iranensis TaxID=76862 RepID=UPI001B088F22|nr:bifunctional lysylphosphatidylglycerol synthetase/lysine--tRNA ligase LysX [Cellulomonas iranensis]MBO9570084.1 bifunctional lysylphosphatidylglycerol synthetase/lysine--tRNA ligase LysX [Cellulomonas iranensis]